MILTIPQFINFATYQHLFPNVSLVNYDDIVQSIKDDPTHLTECHLDEHHVLWSMHGWIDEHKRKVHLNKTFVHDKPTTIALPTTKEQFEVQILEAMNKGEFKQAMALTKEKLKLFPIKRTYGK